MVERVEIVGEKADQSRESDGDSDRVVSDNDEVCFAATTATIHIGLVVFFDAMCT